jgi:hypothetical protein
MVSLIWYQIPNRVARCQVKDAERLESSLNTSDARTFNQLFADMSKQQPSRNPVDMSKQQASRNPVDTSKPVDTSNQPPSRRHKNWVQSRSI